MATPYLTLEQLKLRAVIPDEYFDDVETRYPGFIDQRLASRSAWLDARLRKRYAAQFAAPYPEQVCSWLCDLVTVDVMHKRGIDPNDEQWTEIMQASQTAKDEVKEAADSQDGLFDLPLRDDAGDASGIAKGGPFGYSEASPYVWKDVQASSARTEDRNGRGSDV